MGLLVLLGGCRTLDDPGTSAASTTVLWSGGVTPTSAVVTARTPDTSAVARLRLTSRGDTAVVAASSRPAPGVHRFNLEGLTPSTEYVYTLVTDAQTERPQSRLSRAGRRTGRFETFAEGPFSFRIAISGCADTGSEHPVFDVIRQTEPDLFVHPGDMHYENIGVNDPATFRDAYHRVHASSRQSALYRSTPLAYVWDDHDYGPNNSSRRAPGQDAAQTVYREYVPHYPLAAGDGAKPVHHAFTMGRVRVIVSDLRSARSANDAPDTATKTMMGAEQKAWFKQQLIDAKDRYPLIVWVSSVPWIADDSQDRWSGFATEREELATFIDSIGVNDQLAILSGDAHMVALDDGTNNRYGRADGGGFPVVQAAALDRRGSVKGGPYTHGPYPNRVSLFGDKDGQFVLMDVQDDGGEQVCVTWTGRRYRYDDRDVVTLLSWQKCFDAVPEDAEDARP